jgi:hypothetical protein
VCLQKKKWKKKKEWKRQLKQIIAQTSETTPLRQRIIKLTFTAVSLIVFPCSDVLGAETEIDFFVCVQRLIKLAFTPEGKPNKFWVQHHPSIHPTIPQYPPTSY